MENTNKKKQSNFILQGSVLAIASLVVRIIGMIYRIPLTGIIGDEGNGIYSVAYEIYAILLLISSYSLPLAVSKLMAALVARGETQNAKKYFRCSLVFAIVVGGVVSVFTYVFADFLAGDLMKSPMSTLSLKVLAPAIFVVAVMGVMRGYFQGMGSMVPTAISQVVEQIINAIVSVWGAAVLFSYGEAVVLITRKEGFDAAYGAAGGTLGTLMGAVAGLVTLVILMLFFKRAFVPSEGVPSGSVKTDSTGKVYKVLLMTIVPVILSTAVYNLSNVLDQGVFNRVLASQGKTSEEYNALWGIFSGKYRLLTNVPIALASAMVSSTVIGISAAVAVKDRREIVRRTRVCIRFTMAITIPCAVGLAVLASPVLQLLWGDKRALPANLLRYGSISVVLYALSTLSNGILQGINRMRIPVRNALIALVTHLVLLYVLLSAFKMHVYGVVIANIFFALMMCILNGRAMKRYIRGYRQEVVRTFIIPAINSAIMGVVVFFVYKGIFLATKSNILGVAVSVIIGVLVYFAGMIYMGGITRKDLKSFPKGRLLVAVAEKLRLL